MTDPENIFENIIVAAKRSIDWKLNLILTPAELEVLVAEIERLTAALEKYADPVNWEWIKGVMYSDTVAKHFVPPANFDHRIAEEALRSQAIARTAWEGREG